MGSPKRKNTTSSLSNGRKFENVENRSQEENTRMNNNNTAKNNQENLVKNDFEMGQQDGRQSFSSDDLPDLLSESESSSDGELSDDESLQDLLEREPKRLAVVASPSSSSCSDSDSELPELLTESQSESDCSEITDVESNRNVDYNNNDKCVNSSVSRKKKKKKKKNRKNIISGAESGTHSSADDVECLSIHNESLRKKPILLIQSVARRFLTRLKYGARLTSSMRESNDFKTIWNPFFEEMKLVNGNPSAFSWYLEKEKFDMVFPTHTVDDDVDVTGDQQKAFQDISNEEIRRQQSLHSVDEFENVEDNECMETPLATNNESTEEDLEEADGFRPYSSAVRGVEFTENVMKWLLRADTRYRLMFSDRVERLAQGERSHMLAKRLKGCNSPVFEAKLDSGQRILWTHLFRHNESPSIIVWFVSKHDRISHCAQLLNKCFERIENLTKHVEHNRSGDCLEHDETVAYTDDGIMLSEDMCLLDPLRNSPLKIYMASIEEVKYVTAKKVNVNRFQMRLNRIEKDVNFKNGTTLLLGRSGTGKTVCLCNRMAQDRKSTLTIAGDSIAQLFVCRSRRLRDSIQRYYDTHCRIVLSEEEIDIDAEEEERRLQAEETSNQADFLTLDEFVDHMDSVISQECSPPLRKYEPFRLVEFITFRDYIYPTLVYKSKPTKLDPLVLWTQFKTHLKGSFEAWRESSSSSHQEYKGILSLSTYLNTEIFPPARCRLDDAQRQEAYELCNQYQEFLARTQRWDETDRVMDMLHRFGEHQGDCQMDYTGKGWPYNKIYVDEIQDSTQIDITLLFLSSGFEFDSLFLAGDNAQSIVEGVDFRFEEVRSIMYSLGREGKGHKKHQVISKPVTLVTNFRSHSGILRCASEILDMMFHLFPHAAKVLEKDKGLCTGPRPVYFFDVDSEHSALNLILLQNPQLVVLYHEKFDENGKCLVNSTQSDHPIKETVPNGTLALSIKDAKGLEFDDVVIVDFFSVLPRKVQDWWKKRFQNSNSFLTVETQVPQMEMLFKLLYTAITRACNRLLFVETQKTPAALAFFRWLKNKELAEPYAYLEIDTYQNVERVYMSNDEWRLRGLELVLAAERDSSTNLTYLQNALKCFERAGEMARSLMNKVQVLIQFEMVKQRLKQFANFSEERPSDDALLKDAAIVMQHCIKEKLLDEARDLSTLIKPFYDEGNMSSQYNHRVIIPLKSKSKRI